jgi:CBS domain-containing protein
LIDTIAAGDPSRLPLNISHRAQRTRSTVVTEPQRALALEVLYSEICGGLMRLQDVMTDQVYQVSPDTSAEIAWNIMSMHRIHHLVVTQDGRIVGLLSARDFGRIKGRRARERHSVGDLMTLNVTTASPTTTVRRAANMMHGSAIGCLVIVDRRRIVGIVTVADLLDVIDTCGATSSSESQGVSAHTHAGGRRSRPRVGTSKRSTGRLSSHRRAALRMPAVPAPAQ